MKLLLDANLSWRLCTPLEQHFSMVEHVSKTPLPFPASDLEIWNYAKNGNFCIVSNDEDFLKLLLQRGFPPNLVLLRTGNQSNVFLKDLLIKHASDVFALEQSIDYGLLEIYD